MNRLYLLNPVALWLMLLLVGVVVLHILRMPRARFRISSVLFLRSMELDQKRRRRDWRTLISLLIQAAILGLLVLAAAKPLLSSGRLKERRTVVIMDTSASMRARDGARGKTRFERCQELASDLVKRMEHGDRMLLVAVDRHARMVHQFEKDRRTLLRVIESMEPGFESTRLEEAFKLVRQVIRPFADPQVFLISDGAVSLDRDAFKDVLGKTRFLQVGQQRENVGIVSFAARRNVDSERDFTALVSVQNTFATPCRTRLKLEIGKTVVDYRDLEIGPGETRREMFEMPKLVGGRFRASLELLDETFSDVYADDNVAYEWIPVLKRSKVLVVTPESESGGYLDAAMSANIGVMAYRVPPEEYRPTFAVDAAVFYNWVPDEFPDADLLFVNTGGESPHEALREEFVLQPVMRSWDRTHPLMNYISLENLLLDRARRLSPQRWLEPVARTIQVPIILAGRREAGKVVYVAFDPRESDFPFRVAFPILLGNVLKWFSEEDDVRYATQIQPGQVYEIGIPDSVRSVPETIAVTDPTGRISEVAVRDRHALYEMTVVPGLYRYTLDGRPQGFGVSVGDAAESDIGLHDDVQAAVQAADEGDHAAPLIERELWFTLSLLLMLALCVESYLYHQRIVF